jgi:hypothetical protein
MTDKNADKLSNPYTLFVVHMPDNKAKAIALADYCRANGLDFDHDPDPGASETYCTTCGCSLSEHFAGGNEVYCPNVRGL